MSAKLTQVRGWLPIALAVSLIVNFFLIAVIGGRWLHHGPAQVESGSQVLARAIANAEASLSPADAAAFGAVMTRDAPRYEQAGRQLGEDRVALERQITAEPYDPQAVRQAFARWQASWNRFIDSADDTIVEALGRISPEGRRKLIEQRHQGQPGVRLP